jgi:hypothetical protein
VGRKPHYTIKGQTMRFLVTMNMGSGNNNLVHQFVFDHESESMSALLEYINDNSFILVTHYYWDKERRGLRNMGRMVINTYHMGKVVEYTGAGNEVADTTGLSLLSPSTESGPQRRLTRT